MNTETQELLKQLAAKLGTTTEYLWAILLKQAPIDATITLFQFILVVFACYGLYRAHKNLLKPIVHDKRDSYRYDSGYDKYEMAVALPMVFGALILTVLVLVLLGSVGDVISGYFNPEYWALNKILTTIKH